MSGCYIWRWRCTIDLEFSAHRGDGGFALIDTSPHKLTSERDGATIVIWINDVFVGAYNAPTPLTTGHFGVVNWASQFDTAIADFNEITVTARDAGGAILPGGGQPGQAHPLPVGTAEVEPTANSPAGRA